MVAGVSSVLGASVVASVGAGVSVAGAGAGSSFFLVTLFTFFSALLFVLLKGARSLWRRLGLFLPGSVVSFLVSAGVSSFVASVGV